MNTTAVAILPPRTWQQAGFGIIELLVAVAINLFVIAASVVLFMKARDLQRTQDTQARLQETATYALSVLEADVRMAGYFGLAPRPDRVTQNPWLELPDRCGGASWIVDIGRFIDGANNDYLAQANCAALAGGAQAGADVLVVRRASARSIPLQDTTVDAAIRNNVLVVSQAGSGEIFLPRAIGDVIPTGYEVGFPVTEAPRTRLHSLLMHAYYVSVDSSVARGFPALRRKTLTGGPGIGDEEIAPGVEDLQVRVGMDTDGDADADAFVNPGEWLDGAVPVSVQLWLRVRALERDAALGEIQATAYADRSWAASQDAFHRVLVTRTIQLKNPGR